MPVIIKVYKETLPGSRFVGIRYGAQHKVDGSFAHLWRGWFEHGRFDALMALSNPEWQAAFPEAGSFIGLMRHSTPGDFEYWIGMFLPPDSPVPAGFDSLAAPAMEAGVCWVRGQEPAIYWQENACLEALREQFSSPRPDQQGQHWVWERYTDQRFTPPDEQGSRVLDMVFMLRELPGDGATDQEEEAMENISDLHYCPHCRRAYPGEACPECHKKGTALDPQDPIYIGELPGRLRNALQIAFSATEIPFNALSTLGTGFTLSAGDIFESYKIYVPYERSAEAREAFLHVFQINDDTP